MGIRAGARRPAEYVKAPQERGFKRVVNLDLDDERWDPVFKYAAETAPDRPVQDGIRDLLLQAIAENAVNGAILAARQQAYAEARDHVAREIWNFLRKLARDLQLAPLPGEAVGPSSGNFIAADSSEKAA